MNVLVAQQSPTLFNILARSTLWNMTMAPMGDHEGLSELELLDVPGFISGRHPEPDVVMVCSPDQLRLACTRFPDAIRLWVLHNGHPHMLSREHEGLVAGAVTFSRRVQWLQSGRSVPVYFVSPAYEANSTWGWEPDRLWTLRNRPKTRQDDIASVVPAVCRGLSHTFYGQGQTAGFARPGVVVPLRAGCSAYVSCLDRCAGFGLAEHESFAAGVPVIGSWWGDLAHELGQRYWGIQYDIDEMALAARRVCEDRDAAAELSEIGLDYIREHRTQARMDETIREMISNFKA